MGISRLSDVSTDSGLLITVIIMAGVSFASIKRLLAALLQILGLKSSEPEAMESSLAFGSGSHLARFLLIAELDRTTSKSLTTFGNVADCAVCLCKVDEGVDQICQLRCSHLFHRSCIDKWVDYGQQVACPLCRSSIISEETAMKMEQQLTEELMLWFRGGELDFLVEQ